ncbi:MAG: C39 family peptidase [Lachnospiraceae bacterium]|nr:C39 family peptidase [Lachnospiraceae bacterium]
MGAVFLAGLIIGTAGASASEKVSADENVAEAAVGDMEAAAGDTKTAAEAAVPAEGVTGEADGPWKEAEAVILTDMIEMTGETAAQEVTGQQEEAETDLLNDFVSRYGTVVPRDLSDKECIKALAELAEQYPEFEPIYEAWEDYPMELLVALCNNPEMVDFVAGYLDADTETAGELTEAEVGRDFPYYLQWDERWGYLPYGASCLGLSGCGPTCLSMVVVALTDNAEASPAAIGEFAMENGYYMSGTGTKWALMTKGAASFGVIGTELLTTTSEEDLLDLLEEGYPVICSVKAGDFTNGGHFIVLAGVEDGQIRVYDPNSVERSSRLWDYETLRKQMKKMWVFEAAERGGLSMKLPVIDAASGE